MYGWVGKILNVDLTTEEVVESPLKEKLIKGYLGGRGINMRILWDEAKSGLDSFSPENIMVFGAGPLVGTMVFSTSRFNVSVRKSPISVTFGDSNCGGHWGPELKFAGYDNIVIRGKAKRPVYLWVSDGNAELRDADEIWGKTTWEATEIIKKELGDPEIRVATIGPAGENLVRYACVISDYVRAAGRCGTGAVMGSKNLKAIAVRGTKGLKIAMPEAYEKVAREIWDVIWGSIGIEDKSKYGTLLLTTWSNSGGHFTTRNSQNGWFEDAEKLMVDYLWPKYHVRNHGCFACPVHCAGLFVVKEGPFKGLILNKCEYVSVYSFGSNHGNSYFPAILKATELCSKYGLSVDGAGFAISFAMECYEKGILTKKDTDGLVLEWGDYRVVHSLLEKIAKRKGIGNILAEGPKIAAEIIGKGAEKYQHTIKGMPLYGDMRCRKGYGLAYATSTRGPDHLRGASILEFMAYCTLEKVQDMIGKELAPEAGTIDPLSLKGKGPLLAWTENLCAVIDSVGICKMLTSWDQPGRLGYTEIARILSTVTSWDIDANELMKIGERIYNLERALNAIDGITREDDVLPKRQNEPIPSGPKKGEKIDLSEFEMAKTEYYKVRGWNEKTGLPTRKKLEELELADVATEFRKAKI